MMTDISTIPSPTVYGMSTAEHEIERTAFMAALNSAHSFPIFEKPPVRTEGGSIVCSHEMMSMNKFYPVELDGHTILVRRNEDGTIDLYELVVE